MGDNSDLDWFSPRLCPACSALTQVKYGVLLDVFFNRVDPTTKDR